MRRGTSYVSIVATALLWQMVSDSPWPWWEQDRLWPSGRQPQTLSKGEEEILVWFTAVGTGLIHSHTWRAHWGFSHPWSFVVRGDRWASPKDDQDGISKGGTREQVSPCSSLQWLLRDLELQLKSEVMWENAVTSFYGCQLRDVCRNLQAINTWWVLHWLFNFSGKTRMWQPEKKKDTKIVSFGKRKLSFTKNSNPNYMGAFKEANS